MAFYGYDPMASVPNYAGYNQAAQQIGTAIQGAGQAIDMGLKNRETKTGLYAKSAAWLANIPDMPAELKTVPPPNAGETSEAYQTRISTYLHDSLLKYRDLHKNDPDSATKLAASARAVEDQFPQEAESMRQESVSKEFRTPEMQQSFGASGARQMPEAQQAELVKTLPAETAAPDPGEPQSAFNTRQTAEYNKEAYGKSDIGRMVEFVLNDPVADAKTKSQTLQSFIKWDTEQNRTEREKEKTATAKDLEGKRKNFAKLATAFKVIDRTTGKFVESGFDVNNPDAYYVSNVPVNKLPSVHISKREGGLNSSDLPKLYTIKKAYQAELDRMITSGYSPDDPETMMERQAIINDMAILNQYIDQASGKSGYKKPEEPSGTGTGW